MRSLGLRLVSMRSCLAEHLPKLAWKLLLALPWMVGSVVAQPPPVPPLEATETLAQFEVREGYRLELVAAEPLVQDPVAFDWDAQGRLWVVEMADYPSGLDGRGQPGGRVRVLEDRNGDGQYDHADLFLSGLRFPNGVLTHEDGVIITAAPDILFAADRDGDGQADEQRVLFTGFHQGNQQLRMNGLRWGLDNWIYCASGSHHAGYGKGTAITSRPHGKEVVLGSRDFRFHPASYELDPQSGPSQFGRNRDDWGNWFGVQNSFPLWHYVLQDHYVRRNPAFVPSSVRHMLSEPNPRLYPIKQPQKRFHSFAHADRFTSACSGMIYRDNALFGEGPADQLHAFTCAPFHSLIQHHVLTREGVTFRRHRDPAERMQDIVASRDRWFRPVMTRTGPDGALWIADMYRYVIEHPQWVNDAARSELAPYWRSGETRGRIYRLVNLAHDHPSPAAKPSISATVGGLSSGNGWVRDKTQQALVTSAAKQVATQLESLLSSASPQTRLHALCTLDGLGLLAETQLLPRLADEHPGVRRNAVRLAETLPLTPALQQALARRVMDPDQQVCLQLAATLGQWSEDWGRQLAQLLLRFPQDEFMQAAMLSSLHRENLRSAAEHYLQHTQSPEHVVLVALLRTDEAQSVQCLPEVWWQTVRRRDEPSLRFAVLGAALDVYGYARVVQGISLPRWERVLGQARELVAQDATSLSRRVGAVQLLARTPSWTRADAALFTELLAPHQPPELTTAVLGRHRYREEVDVATCMLEAWPSFSPQRRVEALQLLLTRPVWARELLQFVQRGKLSPSAVDPGVREQLRNHAAESVAETARRVWPQGEEPASQRPLEAWPAGDAQRGRDLFAQRCATCHQLDGLGVAVGPNLAALSDKRLPSLFASIRDPNRAVEAKFVNYVALLHDGRIEQGMVITETGTGIVLRGVNGRQVSLLRSEIEEFVSTGKSLMPEGLLQGLSTAQTADLLEFVRTAP